MKTKTRKTKVLEKHFNAIELKLILDPTYENTQEFIKGPLAYTSIRRIYDTVFRPYFKYDVVDNYSDSSVKILKTKAGRVLMEEVLEQINAHFRNELGELE